MNNDINHLRKALFSQLDRLTDTETMKNPITRAREIETSKQVAEVSKQIIETAKVEVQFMKQMNKQESTFVNKSEPSLNISSSQNSAPVQEPIIDMLNNISQYNLDGTGKIENMEVPEPKDEPEPSLQKTMSISKIEKQRIARKLDAELLEDKKPITANLDGKKPVRIDAKTVIYIPIDKDPEEARKAYLERNSIHKIKDTIKEK